MTAQAKKAPVTETEAHGDVRTISIHGVSVDIRAPYAEGSVLGAREASVLNQTRGENVSNNVRKDVAALLQEHGREKATPKIVELVQAYDKAYELNAVTASRQRGLDPVQKEARAIAINTVNAHLRSTGRKISEFRSGENKAKYDAEVARLMADEKVIEVAKETLAVKAKTPKVGI